MFRPQESSPSRPKQQHPINITINSSRILPKDTSQNHAIPLTPPSISSVMPQTPTVTASQMAAMQLQKAYGRVYDRVSRRLAASSASQQSTSTASSSGLTPSLSTPGACDDGGVEAPVVTPYIEPRLSKEEEILVNGVRVSADDIRLVLQDGDQFHKLQAELRKRKCITNGICKNRFTELFKARVYDMQCVDTSSQMRTPKHITNNIHAGTSPSSSSYLHHARIWPIQANTDDFTNTDSEIIGLTLPSSASPITTTTPRVFNSTTTMTPSSMKQATTSMSPSSVLDFSSART